MQRIDVGKVRETHVMEEVTNCELNLKGTKERLALESEYPPIYSSHQTHHFHLR
jgi:hypothetical protein